MPQIATLAEINTATSDTHSGTPHVPTCADKPKANRSKCTTATTLKITVETTT